MRSRIWRQARCAVHPRSARENMRMEGKCMQPCMLAQHTKPCPPYSIMGMQFALLPSWVYCADVVGGACMTWQPGGTQTGLAPAPWNGATVHRTPACCNCTPARCNCTPHSRTCTYTSTCALLQVTRGGSLESVAPTASATAWQCCNCIMHDWMRFAAGYAWKPT